jgi:hypothetical protein
MVGVKFTVELAELAGFGCLRRKKKTFFFEKKNQKTFAPLRAHVTLAGVTSENSSFFAASLFTKKKTLLLLGMRHSRISHHSPPFTIPGFGSDSVTIESHESLRSAQLIFLLQR